mgnify:CR=1 FL=1
MEYREEVICGLEKASVAIKEAGLNDEWLKNADTNVREIAESVNGYLFDFLLTVTEYRDPDAANLFREGASPFLVHVFLSHAVCGLWSLRG